MIRYTVTLTFKDNTVMTDVPVQKQGFRLIECVGAKGKHAQQSCTIAIRQADAITKLLAQEDHIDAQIYAGPNLIFRGVIKPSLSVSGKGKTEDPLSLDVVDYAEIMHKHVAVDYSKYGISEGGLMLAERVWRDVPASDLILELFRLTGITDRCPVSLPDLPGKSFAFFKLSDGDDLLECINRLLYELCLDYRILADRIEVFPIISGGTLPIASAFVNQMKVMKKAGTKDGIKLKWPRYRDIKCQIYEDDTSFSDPQDFNIIVSGRRHHGIYYENNMHENVTVPPDRFTARWNWSFLHEAVKDADPVLLKDVSASCELRDEKGVDFTTHLDDYDLSGGILYVIYDGWFDTWFGKGWGFHVTANGTVTYRCTQENEKYTEGATDPETVSARYIDDEATVDAFARALLQIQKASVFRYTFSSFERFAPGSFLHIKEDRVLGVAADVRIISSEYDPETGLFSYQAEGAEKMGAVPVFSLPETTGTPGKPQPGDGLKLYADRTFFLKEETDRSFMVKAAGYAVSPRSVISWFLNGAQIQSGGPEIRLRTSELILGLNTVKCLIRFENEDYTDELALSLALADNRTLIEYKWGSSQTQAPPFAPGLWFWRGAPIFLGSGMVSEYGGLPWYASVPPEEEGKPYLWMRISTDGGVKWTYSCITGSPAIDFNIIPISETYKLTSRGVTSEEQDIGFQLSRMNTTAAGVWTIDPPEYADPSQPVGNVYTIHLAKGVAIEKISVTVELPGVGRKSVTVSGVRDAAPKGEYFGILPDLNALMQIQQSGKTPTGEPLWKGDHFVVNVQTAAGEGPVPYAYDDQAQEFRPLREDSDGYSMIMSNVLGDVLKMPDTKLTEAAQYGYFRQLAAHKAFIESLETQEIKLREKGKIESSNYVKGESGFSLDGESGKLSAVNMEAKFGVFSDVTISGKSEFGGNIDSPLFKVISEDEPFGKHVTIGVAPDAFKGYWSTHAVNAAIKALHSAEGPTAEYVVNYRVKKPGSAEFQTFNRLTWRGRHHDDVRLYSTEHGDTYMIPREEEIRYDEFDFSPDLVTSDYACMTRLPKVMVEGQEAVSGTVLKFSSVGAEDIIYTYKDENNVTRENSISVTMLHIADTYVEYTNSYETGVLPAYVIDMQFDSYTAKRLKGVHLGVSKTEGLSNDGWLSPDPEWSANVTSLPNGFMLQWGSSEVREKVSDSKKRIDEFIKCKMSVTMTKPIPFSSISTVIRTPGTEPPRIISTTIDGDYVSVWINRPEGDLLYVNWAALGQYRL